MVRRLLVIAPLVVVALAGGLVAGTLPRVQREREVNAAAAEVSAALPRVTVAVVRRAQAGAERVLPGSVAPLLDAAIYARTTGYLQRRLVDIGDRVEQGQLLAKIATPEIDAQLEQSRATLLQTQANLVRDKAKEVYAQEVQTRYSRLVRSQAISQEDYENATAQARVATANVHATESTIKVNEADILRLETLQSFQKVTAPFAGVITARNVDPGDLISADSPSTTRELFHLMRTDVLRVFVNVPQTFATGIKVGQGAVVYRREEPSKQFKGTVTRTADALDANTRTLLTEVQVHNPENALRPGMYLQVKFVFDRGVVPVLIPAAALATRTDGPRVAVLDGQHRVRYRAVQLGRDYGVEIEVITGLNAGETVVVHPGDDLPEGTAVEPSPPPK
ncbi:MAG TPA: efflux RND transporter periplasmic adaptor subunit [Gemmataceae bacterium]|nr:efflux RND transporter periplasmic adaptor subunit [Gemmataceae bacterium]